MPRSSTVVLRTTQHLLRQQRRLEVGATPDSAQPKGAGTPRVVPVRQLRTAPIATAAVR